MFLEKPRIRAAIRAAAWICVIAIAILSLTPREHLYRTSLGGHFVHVIAYAGCAWLCLVTCGRRRTEITIAGLLVAYAGVLEILQLWVPGRHSGLDDLAASATGVAAGFLAEYIVRRLKM